MDTAEAGRQPIPVTLAGREYFVRPRTFGEIAELQAWFKRRIPGPLVRVLAAFDFAEREGVRYSPATRKAMMEQAQDDELSWPPRPGSLPWIRAIDSREHIPYVIRWLLPHLGEQDAVELYDTAAGSEILELLIAGLLPRPKATAAGEANTTPPSLSPPAPTTSAG